MQRIDKYQKNPLLETKNVVSKIFSISSELDLYKYKNHFLLILLLKYISVTETGIYSDLNIDDDFLQLISFLQKEDGASIDKVLKSISDKLPVLAEVIDELKFKNQQQRTEWRHLKIILLFISELNLEFRGDYRRIFVIFIQQLAELSGKKAGDFFTPYMISHLIAALVRPYKGESIYDPACGTGALLIECKNYIDNTADSHDGISLYGQDINRETTSLAVMNMIFNNVEKFSIRSGDTIREPKFVDDQGHLMNFDIVVSHPPFSIGNWGDEIAINDSFHRFTRGIPPKMKGDYAFILHMIESLNKKSGRMAVVVSHGVLFRSGSEKEIRAKLINEGLLDTIIGLPPNIFYGTGIPSAILFFSQERKKQTILIIDASREFQRSGNKNELSEGNIEKIISCVRNHKEINGYSSVVSIEDIKANDYNLNIPRYVSEFEVLEKTDVKKLIHEHEKKKARLQQLENKMSACLSDIDLLK